MLAWTKTKKKAKSGVVSFNKGDSQYGANRISAAERIRK